MGGKLGATAVWILLPVALWGWLRSPIAAGAVAACVPTRPDIQGPFYKPNAPVRTVVGTGHVLTGTVRSAAHCDPIAQARIEFWLAGLPGATMMRIAPRSWLMRRDGINSQASSRRHTADGHTFTSV